MALFGFIGGLIRAAARIVMPGIVRVARTAKRIFERIETLGLTYTPEEIMRADIMAAMGESEKAPAWGALPRGMRPMKDLFVEAEFRAPYRYWYKVKVVTEDPRTKIRTTEIVSLTSDDVLTLEEIEEQLEPIMGKSKPERRGGIVAARMITGWHDPRLSR